ncbi:MAG: hypothetical protein H0V47_01320, partial [Chloroflexia bacterium]|nr:hypothetical protein [Chloroflexia bacterium]
MRSAIHHQPRAKRNERISPFMILTLLVPVTLLSLAAQGPSVLPGDINITLFLQSRIPAETALFFEMVNWIGSTLVAAVVVILLALLFLALRQPVAAAMILLTSPLR